MDYYAEAQKLLNRPSTQAVLNKADELFPIPTVQATEEAHDFVLELLTELFECEFDDDDWPHIYQCLSELVFKNL
jgi:hypothetical protein